MSQRQRARRYDKTVGFLFIISERVEMKLYKSSAVSLILHHAI